MGPKKIKDLWRKLRQRTSTETATQKSDAELMEVETPDDSRPVGESMDINGVRLVFGVRWSPITQDARLGSQLRQARKKGYTFYILTPQSDAVGLIGSFPKVISQRPHAASLILSEHFSTSGAELFLFEYEEQWSLVGLSDNSPMPGFDTMGTKDEIEALAQEFAAMNAGQTIRYFGNVNWFSDVSLLQPTQLIERLDRRTKLQYLPNQMFRWVTAAFCLLLLGAVVGAQQFLNQKWRKEQATSQLQAENHNMAYELGIDAALSGAGRAGNYSLYPWRSTLQAMPTQAGGWQLKSLECKADQCRALWSRHAGNYLDFDNAFPYAGSARPDLVPKEDGQAELQTDHATVEVPAVAAGQLEPPRRVVRTQLPKIRDAYLQWASFLQDVKLMPHQTSTFSAAKIFASEASIDQITRPVVRASWTLESDLWTLRDLFLPNYVVAEKLEIFPANVHTVVKASGQVMVRDYRYKITGSFYAQGR
jgi:hypothetical protein